MNLKERGVTVGDLLIVIIIVASTFFIVKKFNKDNQTSLILTQPKIIQIK